jgi:uncharacterized protein DUF4386
MTTALSARTRGRFAGAAYHAIFVTGITYQIFIPDSGVLTTDWGATVDHIVANRAALWIGIPFYLLVIVARLVWAQLYYELFRGVNDNVNRLSVLVYLVATTMQTALAICLMAPVVLFDGVEYRAAFTPMQLHSLATLAMQLYIHFYYVALALFGVYSVLLGYVMARSSLVPRAVGASMMLSGLAWLTFSVPPGAAMLIPYNVSIGVFGEAVVIVWLLVMGVYAPRRQAMSDTQLQPSIDATTSTLPRSAIVHGRTK